MKPAMRSIALATAAVAATMAFSSFGASAAEEKVLNVYNWSDYIAEDTIKNFEKRTGIKVRYDVFDSNEVLEAKLLAGSTGYDVVVPSASFLARQIKAGVFRKLDKSKLTNWGNLDPKLLARLAKYDPNNAHAIPYMWGTTGFGYNIDKVKKLLPDAPVDSWRMLFDPKVVSKLKSCGVTLLDAPTEVISAALKYAGHNPNSQKKADLKVAEKLLMKVRPYFKYFHSSQYINDLANGETCVAMGWSGDVLMARDRADEAKKGVHIAYTIPKEGALLWFDTMAIPADAPHPNNATKFLNYILEPKVAAAISNYVFYANPNAAATAYVDDDVKSDPGIYPTAKVKKNLFTATVNTPKFDRLLTRAWTRIKTGQ